MGHWLLFLATCKGYAATSEPSVWNILTRACLSPHFQNLYAPKFNTLVVVPKTVSPMYKYHTVNATVWDKVGGSSALGIVELGFNANPAFPSPLPPSPSSKPPSPSPTPSLSVGCKQPPGYCMSPAKYFYYDCDSDKKLDFVCMGDLKNPNNHNLGILLSTKGCRNHGVPNASWPSALRSSCPGYLWPK